MSARWSQAAFFFFAAVVFFLLAFFEKRLTLIKAQHKAQLEQVQVKLDNLKLVEPWEESFELLRQEQQKLEEHLQLLTLNSSPDQESSNLLAQEMVKQGLQLRSDLIYLWRSIVAEYITNNQQDRAISLMGDLKALPTEIKKNWLESLMNFPNWSDVRKSFESSAHQKMALIKNEEVKGPWNYLGVEVQKQVGGQSPQEQWQPPFDLLEEKQYTQVCAHYLEDTNPERWPAHDMLQKLCLPQDYLKVSF